MGEEKIDGFGELIAKMAEAKKSFDEEHGDLELQSDFKFPMEVSKISIRGNSSRREAGTLVRVRPLSDQKTYLGIHLGDLYREVMLARGSKSKELMVTIRANPAIWVPDLEKVIWGDSSWWAKIETKEDAEKIITEEMIQNAWYVKALKRLEKKAVCPACKGTGVEYKSQEGYDEERAFTCPVCDGDGVVKKEGEKDA